MQLSRPRAANDPEGVLYVLHRCTAPMGPDTGRVVRMAARGGAPPSMAALYGVLTKALGRKGQPPVAAVMTAAGKAVTSPSQVRVCGKTRAPPSTPPAAALQQPHLLTATEGHHGGWSAHTQLTSGQHLFYACDGDRKPRVVKKVKRSTKVAKATAEQLLASSGASVLVRTLLTHTCPRMMLPVWGPLLRALDTKGS